MNGINKLHIILLSGGSGTRLWPLSNDERSKQFLKVLRNSKGDHVSMVQRTFEQISRMIPSADVTVATCASQLDALNSQVNGTFARVIEPERRDTAPAIMLACQHLWTEQAAQKADPVIVLPIDSYVDDAYFGRVSQLAEAITRIKCDIALLGVTPTYPSEKYGYIVPSSPDGIVRQVECFTEKPKESIARQLINKGALWNCGVFGFKLSYILELISNYGNYSTYEELRNNYRDLPKNSFDYEVVEKAQHVVVVPYDGAWKDLGTWNTLTEEMALSTAGKVVMDETTCNNVHAINETQLPMLIAGISNAVVVATPDGILVSDKNTSARIKGLIKEAAESHPMQMSYSWGGYRIISTSDSSITRELYINEGERYTREAPAHPAVWTIIEGRGHRFSGNKPLALLNPGSTVKLTADDRIEVRAQNRMIITEIIFEQFAQE